MADDTKRSNLAEETAADLRNLNHNYARCTLVGVVKAVVDERVYLSDAERLATIREALAIYTSRED